MPDPAPVLLLPATALWTAALARGLIRLYRDSKMEGANYRGRAVPAALGPALLLGILPGAAAAAWGGAAAPQAAPLLFLLTGFAFLGLWDDLMSDRTSGFKGHFAAGREGRLTGGLLKVITALPVAFIFAAALPFPLWRRLAALPLLLLSANGINLFDRRPGRALKIFFAGAVATIFLAHAPAAAAQLLLPLMAGALALAPLDLEAAGMLGDCGANMLGVILGAAAVLCLPLPIQAALLLFWSGIHLFSEYYSISRLIEGAPLLHRLDCLGRFREK